MEFCDVAAVSNVCIPNERLVIRRVYFPSMLYPGRSACSVESVSGFQTSGSGLYTDYWHSVSAHRAMHPYYHPSAGKDRWAGKPVRFCIFLKWPGQRHNLSYTVGRWVEVEDFLLYFVPTGQCG